ncbi:MAG: RNA 2'-phosphotransferase [Desulfobacterales bacterium]|nr:MAG: RNA 2'-phosphotransferase [Desulfobacterales bacterium]
MVKQTSSQQLSKLIAYILERRPDEFGLVVNLKGYVKVKELLKAVHEEAGWKYVRRSHLDEILITISDPPFEISDKLIRARHREHLPEKVLIQNPPKLLYTCIRPKAYPYVIDKGIFPLGYPQVILSSSRGLAVRMGKRIDPSPVLLTVQVPSSVAKGVVYFQAGETLYLADFIPEGCFTGPPLPKAKVIPKKAEAIDQPSELIPAGSFFMDKYDNIHHVPPRYQKKVSKKMDLKKIKKHRRKREPPPWRR